MHIADNQTLHRVPFVDDENAQLIVVMTRNHHNISIKKI